MTTGIPIPDAALALVERALNQVIALDPEGARRLAALQGRVILIEFSGFGTRFYLLPGVDRLQLFGAYDAAPDCTLRGTPLALARIGLTERRTDSLFTGDVEVDGDTALAQQFGQFIAELDIDWEEQLAHLIGDSLAHQIGETARAAGDWGQRSGDTLIRDLREYLQEEARLVPTDYEVRAFIAEVDTLRDDVERLAARVERLGRDY
ncbi:SCP2 sterol-binding domain-containing protein [Thioalkalicoccus limnaeus]|uniref:Ubiquinone biosynthesis accessory factor UbiJ n=1 Tax=Thioalkalicoccus limnaeus TaxID=120681 RepID=A0ABV4BAY8_9GAMM